MSEFQFAFTPFGLLLGFSPGALILRYVVEFLTQAFSAADPAGVARLPE